MIRLAFLIVLLACSAFAGNFQAKNDTVPNGEYYVDMQDSVYRAMGEKRTVRPEHNTCAWTADCPVPGGGKREERRPRRTGPRWLKDGTGR